MGGITGRLVGAAGPTALAVPTVGQVVENVTALRALVGSADLPAVTLAQYQSAVPGKGGGVFMWDAAAGDDDGVLRFNAGGEESSGEGWRRVFSGALYSSWGGAVGDGSTPDATALQRVLDASAGAEVVIEEGTYACAAGLTAGAGTAIRAHGATLDFSAAGNVAALTVGSGCEVHGLTLSGPSSGTYNDAGRGIVCAGTSNDPAAPTYVTGPVVRDCAISGFAGYGVHLTFCEFARVERCALTDIGYAGVAGLSCRDCSVEHNDISAIGYTGVVDAYGAFIDRSNGASETSVPRSYRCRFAHNRIADITIVANGQGLDTHAGVDFEFTDNLIRNCNVGIAVVPSVLGASYALAPQRCYVARNIIVGTGANSGIIVAGASDDGGTTINEYAEGCAVQGNTVEDAASEDIDDGAVRFYGTKSISVIGNNILRPTVNGINATIHNHGMVVSGNTIVDPHGAAIAGVCVRINGNDNTGAVVGNTFRYDDAGVDTLVADYGVLVAAGRLDCDVMVRDNARITSGSPNKLQVETNDVAGIVAAQHYEGTDDPESAVLGYVGDFYTRKTGGGCATLYVKESGDWTTTGWRPMAAVGALAPGSVSLGAGQWHIQYQRLQLTGTQRLTLAGTARYILTDL